MWPYIIICPFPPPHSSGNTAAELGDIFIVFNENGILRKNASFESLILENITGLYIQGSFGLQLTLLVKTFKQTDFVLVVGGGGEECAYRWRTVVHTRPTLVVTIHSGQTQTGVHDLKSTGQWHPRWCSHQRVNDARGKHWRVIS